MLLPLPLLCLRWYCEFAYLVIIFKFTIIFSRAGKKCTFYNINNGSSEIITLHILKAFCLWQTLLLFFGSFAAGLCGFYFPRSQSKMSKRTPKPSNTAMKDIATGISFQLNWIQSREQPNREN